MKYFSLIKLTLFSLLLLLIFSCEKDKMFGDVIVDNELYDYIYSQSNDTLLIDTQKLVLGTELYRNFFPGGNIPEKRRLIAHVEVKDIDSLSIVNTIDITTIYVINNEQIWISTPEDCDNCYYPEYILHRNSIDGPEWETNIYVDVIVEITDFNASSNYYLIARDQLIWKVE